MNLRFEQTCGSSPEQYDVYDENNNQVAYVRLRYGYLRVYCPDYGCEAVYEHVFSYRLKGCFDDEQERSKYMKRIRNAIIEYYEDLEENEDV